MQSEVVGMEAFSTPERTEKSRDLSTARGSTCSNRYLRLDFEQPPSRDAKELHSLIQSSKRQLLQQFRRKQLLEEQILQTAVLDENFLQLHESRRQIAISIAEEEMAIARYEREQQMLAAGEETHRQSADEPAAEPENHSFSEEAGRRREEGPKVVEMESVLKEIQPAAKAEERQLKPDSRTGREGLQEIKKHQRSRTKVEETDPKDSESSSQRGMEPNEMNLVESMLADISKLKNLDQLLQEKEEQKRIVRCLMQMERINAAQPHPEQQSSLFN